MFSRKSQNLSSGAIKKVQRNLDGYYNTKKIMENDSEIIDRMYETLDTASKEEQKITLNCIADKEKRFNAMGIRQEYRIRWACRAAGIKFRRKESLDHTARSLEEMIA